jgi:hypothetical protein
MGDNSLLLYRLDSGGLVMQVKDLAVKSIEGTSIWAGAFSLEDIDWACCQLDELPARDKLDLLQFFYLHFPEKKFFLICNECRGRIHDPLDSILRDNELPSYIICSSCNGRLVESGQDNNVSEYKHIGAKNETTHGNAYV